MSRLLASRAVGLWAMVLSTALLSSPARAAELEAPPSPQAIAALVKDLGDTSYQTREAAEKKLQVIGAPALDQLTKAVDSDDAEVKDRATRLVRAIRRAVVRSDALWQLKLGAPVTAGPVVSGTMLYVGTGDHKLHAIDTGSGKEKWVATLSGIVQGSPIVMDSLVVVGAGNAILCAFDVESGKRQWEFKTGGGMGAPALSGGNVVVAGTGQLYALDAATGKIAWQVPLKQKGTIGAPAAAGDTLYVADPGGTLAAYDSKTGKESWTVDVASNVITAPVAEGGAIYLGTLSGVVAVDVQTRQKKWEYAGATMDNGNPQLQMMLMRQQIQIRNQAAMGVAGANTPGSAAPMLDRGTVYYAAGGMLHAIDAANGTAKWTYEPEVPSNDDNPAEAGNAPGFNGAVQFQGRLIVNGMVVVGGMSGAGNQPAIHQDTAYLGASAGLFAADTRNGLQLWRFMTPQPVVGRPVIADGAVYFAAGGGADGPMMLVGPRGRVAPANNSGESILYALPVRPRPVTATTAPAN